MLLFIIEDMSNTNTIYSWMDSKSIWWSSLEPFSEDKPLPSEYISKINIEKNGMWVIQHSNYSEVNQFHKAVRSA